VPPELTPEVAEAVRSLASGNAGSTYDAPVAIVRPMTAASRPGYVVLRQVGKDRWQLVGEADRKPGQTAKQSRAQAIQDATRGKAKPGEIYRAILRSEWKIASE